MRGDCRLEDTTKRDVISDAKDRVTTFSKAADSKTKKIIECFAIITTVVTIALYVVLYAYKTGYLDVFGIPASCVKVNLVDYLPALYRICAVSIYIVWYVISKKTFEIIGSIDMEPIRVMYGYYVVLYLSEPFGIYKNLPAVFKIIIPLCVSLIVELVLYFKKKPRKNSKKDSNSVSKKEYALILENTVHDLLLSRYYNTGVFIVILAVTLAPILGRASAKNNESFQLCDVDNEAYAVIADYGDTIIAQKAKENDNQIEINTSSYTFFAKDNIEFTYNQYNNVLLVSEFSTDTDQGSSEFAR